MLKNNILRIIIWTVVISTCSTGFILQVYNVSYRYFQYHTETVASIDIPTEAYFPSISTCWRMNEILDMKSIQSDYGIKLRRWNQIDFSWDDYNIGIEIFTLADSTLR